MGLFRPRLRIVKYHPYSLSVEIGSGESMGSSESGA